MERYTHTNIDGLLTLKLEVLDVSLAAARTLTAKEVNVGMINVSVGHATNVLTLGGGNGKLYLIKNSSATLAASVKNVAGDTAIVIAATKSAILGVSGTGIFRVTADA